MTQLNNDIHAADQDEAEYCGDCGFDHLGPRCGDIPPGLYATAPELADILADALGHAERGWQHCIEKPCRWQKRAKLALAKVKGCEHCHDVTTHPIEALDVCPVREQFIADMTPGRSTP